MIGGVEGIFVRGRERMDQLETSWRGLGWVYWGTEIRMGKVVVKHGDVRTEFTDAAVRIEKQAEV
jgi:hypothetical protein